MNQQEQQELQQRILELNMLDAKFKEMQQQIQIVDQQLNELQILENNLNEIEKTKENSETLSQLGPGVFIKSSIKKNNEVFVDIGSKIIVKKNPEETKQLIKKRIEQVMNVRNIVMQEINNLVLNIQFLERQIQEKVKEQNHKNIQG